MTRISEILKNSTAPKARGHLKYTNDSGKVEYCALGVLGCNIGILPDKNYFGVDDSLYTNILKQYEVDEDMIFVNFGDELDFIIERKPDSLGSGTFYPKSLYELIFGLNDCTTMSFKEIGEFIETNLGL